MVSIINPAKSGNPAIPMRVGPNFLLQIRVFNAVGDGGIAQTSGLQYSLDDGVTWSSTGLVAMGNYDTSTSGTVTGRTYGVRITTTAGAKTLLARVSNSVPVANVLSNRVPVMVVDLASVAPGDGNLLVRDNSSQLCADCHGRVMTHSSESTSSSYGAWSTNCRDCHTPHTTRNVGLVRESITAPELAAGSPANRTVVLRNLAGGYTTGTTASGYANDAETGVCQVCHTRTEFYRQDGFDYPKPSETQTASGGHYPGEPGGCVSCHKHTAGLRASCNGCHGSASNNAPPVVAPDTIDYVANGGVHQAHVAQTTYTDSVLACAECHATPNPIHPAGTTTTVSWGATATGGGTVTVSPVNGSIASWKSAPTCSNYCHGATLAAGFSTAKVTPDWRVGVTPISTPKTCTACHGAPPQTGDHASTDTVCGTCHDADYSLASATVDPSLHMNGSIEASGCTTCHGTPGVGAYPPLVAFNPAVPVGAVSTPVAGGAHTAHLNDTTYRSAPVACDDCHSGFVSTAASHKNGFVTVAWSALASTGNTPQPSSGSLNGTFSTSPNCTNYCHGATLNATAPTAVWTATFTVTCQQCHLSPPAITRNHPQNPTCDSCHSHAGNTGYDFSTPAVTTGARNTHINQVTEKPENGCRACHGSLQNAGVNNTDLAAAPGYTAGISVDSKGNTDVPSRGVGLHRAHLVQTTFRSQAIACTECHAGSVLPNNLDVSHADGTAATAAGTLASTSTMGGTGQTITFNGTTCASTFCHGNFEGGLKAAPSWLADATLACNSCHLVPPVPKSADASSPASYHPNNSDCLGCHGTGYSSTSVATATHLDGAPTLVGARTGCVACHGTPGTAINDATNADPNVPAAYVAAGVHAAHVNPATATKISNPIHCTECHGLDKVSKTDHANGSAAPDWSEAVLADAGSVTPAYNAGNCTAYCHGDGLVAPVNTTLSWTTTLSGCNVCHGNGASLAPPSHDAAIDTAPECYACHPETVNTSGGIIFTAGVTKHINGSLQVSATCLGCHAKPAVGTNTRAQIVGLTAVTPGTDGDDFLRPSRHVSNGTTVSGTPNVLNADCVLCHAEGSISASTADTGDIKPAQDPNLHGASSPTVDLRDLDANNGEGVAAKWPGKRKAAATITAFDRDRMDWFCLTCHDGDGAAGVSVATGNTAFAVSPAIVATSIARTTATVTVTAANTLLVGDYVNLTSAITNAAGTAMDYRPGIKLVATRSATQFTYAEAAPAAIASRAVTASFRRYVGSAVGQMTRTTTVVTVNTATAHDLAVGNVVALTPGEAGYWGGWKTVDTVPLPTRFTYREAIAVAPPASTRVQYFVKTSTRAKTPFNTADTLQNARENGSHQIRLWRASNNKVINVKSQFNSENVATGTGFASHHNLNQFNKRYGTKAINNGAWEAYTTKDGVLLTGATGGELAGLHCSDCHLNETNAHGTRNTWYMLSSRDQGTQEPFDVATANSSLVTSNDNCVKCHNRGTYGQNGTLGANSRTAGHQECGRWDGNQTMAFLGATWSSGTTYTGGTLLCLGCHGGRGDTHLGPGLIHGTNENYSPGETGTQKMYRFMGSGPSYPFYSPDGTAGATNWSGATTGSCYNLPSGTATAWGACDQHNSLTDQAVTNRAGRALSY